MTPHNHRGTIGSYRKEGSYSLRFMAPTEGERTAWLVGKIYHIATRDIRREAARIVQARNECCCTTYNTYVRAVSSSRSLKRRGGRLFFYGGPGLEFRAYRYFILRGYRTSG